MNLRYKFERMLEDLSLEEIAEGLVNNTISFKRFRDRCIKEDFRDAMKVVGAKRMSVYTDLAIKYNLSENTIKMIDGIGYF